MTPRDAARRRVRIGVRSFSSGAKTERADARRRARRDVRKDANGVHDEEMELNDTVEIVSLPPGVVDGPGDAVDVHALGAVASVARGVGRERVPSRRHVGSLR